MEKIINEASESLNAWAKTKEIEIEKVMHGGLPEIPMDSFRIIQVLNNIIGNAIKFTPRQGKVTVGAKLRQQDKVIEVSVTDNGAGIAEADLSKVFDKFQQVGERTSTDISGSGLGLSIAKEIIELHFQNKIGYVTLLKSMHEKFHNGRLDIPVSLVKGDYRHFMNNYSRFLDEYDLESMEERMVVTESNCSWMRGNYPAAMEA